MDQVVRRLRDVFEPAGDPQRAVAMAAYMRDLFPFLGLAAPERRRLQREVFRHAPAPASGDHLMATVDELWAESRREYQYAALDWIERHGGLLSSSHLPTLEALILSKPWWDTVDHLCRHPVGDIVARSGAEGRAAMDRWLRCDALWLQRSAVLHMETWRGHMDVEWLLGACLHLAPHKDFFIRKAIGWALRSYAHCGPNEAAVVRSFIAEHATELSGLSKSEALKRVRH